MPHQPVHVTVRLQPVCRVQALTSRPAAAVCWFECRSSRWRRRLVRSAARSRSSRCTLAGSLYDTQSQQLALMTSIVQRSFKTHTSQRPTRHDVGNVGKIMIIPSKRQELRCHNLQRKHYRFDVTKLRS